MKLRLMGLLMMAGGSLFAQSHFSIGVRIGTPGYYAPAPVAVAAYRPPCPGPGYVWIDGYNDAYGRWYDGYWASPPYDGAYWVAPRYLGGRFYAGYWGGARAFDRDDYRFRESRAHEWREHEWRENRGHDRGHGDFDRGREYRRDFHR
jgi:hypothetical protein